MSKNAVIFVGKKRKTAVEIVIDSIKELLIEEKIKPGEQLPNENTISEQLAVSRGSVREAFKILDAYGIIDIRRGDGTYISNGTNQNMFAPLLFQLLVKDRNFNSLLEVRRMLESGIIKLCIAHATADDFNEIIKANQNFNNEIKNHPNEMTDKAKELDIELHRKIAAATHNEIIQGIYNFVIELFKPSINPLQKNVAQNHQGIIDSLMSGDLEMAEKYLDQHIKSWSDDKNIDNQKGNR